MSEPKIRALVGCQHDLCAEEVSYHLDMVRKWRGLPVCENCWKEGDGIDGQERDVDGNPLFPDWSDLPPVKLEDLIG